jgi:hypothetical protein
MKTTVFSSRLPSSLSVPRLLLNTSLWLARRHQKMATCSPISQ